VPVQTFQTRDGYITIFCGKEKFWQLLCEAFGDMELACDPRFATFQARMQNRDLVIHRTQTHFLAKTTGEWMEALSGKVPCAPVRSVTEALCDPELRDRGMLIEIEHPVFGTMRQVNTPVRADGRRKKHRCAPKLGEDTEAILRNYLHYSDERILDLKRSALI
jgi:crotonobetainyl-CoA:carnitine CoA-transferase CaiB-like acyl-CoA transferase